MRGRAMTRNDPPREPILRPYQERDLTAIRAAFANGARRVCYQAPTGSGKTVLFAAVVAGATARGDHTVILGHRDEIVQQVDTALDALGVAHGIIAAGYPETPELPVQVASVATLVRRLDKLAPPDLIVPDECRHAAAPSWRRILDAYPNAKVLGTTATPQRLDGKGLDDIFDTLIIGPGVAELIAQGYLSRFVTYAPAQRLDLTGVRTRAGDFALDDLARAMSGSVIITVAVEEYTRLCAGAPAIAFCVDVAHSQMVAAAFAARGYRAAHVDGKTPKEERRRLIDALGTGALQVLCNCGLISEGLDVPAVVADILLRPTKSLALYLQQVGRALRPAEGKRALILDHAGNTFRFGLADMAREWSLAGRAKIPDAAPVRCCPQCGALVALAAWHCPECGGVLRQAAPALPHRERAMGRLVELDRLAGISYRQALRWAGTDEQRLRLVAKARGYKPGWVWHRLQDLRGGGA
jgi:DNA repair protein RadD